MVALHRAGPFGAGATPAAEEDGTDPDWDAVAGAVVMLARVDVAPPVDASCLVPHAARAPPTATASDAHAMSF
jgi:hypothetical protein